MKIQMIETDKIIPYENNNKIHPENQIKIIAESIKKFKFDQPIVIDENNIVIKGHGRLLAAQQLGLEKCPVIIRTDMSEAEKKASRIADNKSNESEWDFAALDIELAELKEMDFDIDWMEFGKNKKERGGMETIRIKPYKKTHILLSFPPERIIDIKEHLEKILEFDFIDYEQSSN